MTQVASWGPTPNPEAQECTDPACGTCQVLDAGAAVICAAAGGEYAEVRDRHTKAHYRLIAGEVLAAMSDAMLEARLVQPVEPTDG